MVLQKSYIDINNSFAVYMETLYTARQVLSHYSRVIYSTIIICGTSCRADGSRDRLADSRADRSSARVLRVIYVYGIAQTNANKRKRR